MKNTQTKWLVAISVAVTATVVIVNARVHTQTRLAAGNALTTHFNSDANNVAVAPLSEWLRPKLHFKEKADYRNEAERRFLVAKWKKLAALWFARTERDVTREIAPYLEDEKASFRNKAAQMLGRLDNEEATQLLESKWQKQQEDKARRKQEKSEKQDRELQNGEPRRFENEPPNQDIDELTFRLALGSAKGHKLQGKKRIETLLQNVGISSAQVEEYTTEIQDFKQAAQWRDSPIKDVAIEIVDVLYRMRRRGEKIDGLVSSDFPPGPALDVKLKGAGLPKEEEIKAAVDYAVRPKSGSYVESYLLDLGSEATEVLLERLKEIEQSPQKNRGDWNCISTFRAAAMTEDPRVVPLLEKFKQSENSTVRGYAINTLDDIEHDMIVPRVPA